jgi:hypothetical protein
MFDPVYLQQTGTAKYVLLRLTCTSACYMNIHEKLVQFELMIEVPALQTRCHA